MSDSIERIAVVIGGASGIGWATARALAADGCRVTVADRNTDGARSRATELGDPHTAAHVDVTDEDSVQRLFDETGSRPVAVRAVGAGPDAAHVDRLHRTPAGLSLALRSEAAARGVGVLKQIPFRAA